MAKWVMPGMADLVNSRNGFPPEHFLGLNLV